MQQQHSELWGRAGWHVYSPPHHLVTGREGKAKSRWWLLKCALTCQLVKMLSWQGCTLYQHRVILLLCLLSHAATKGRVSTFKTVFWAPCSSLSHRTICHLSAPGWVFLSPLQLCNCTFILVCKTSKSKMQVRSHHSSRQRWNPGCSVMSHLRLLESKHNSGPLKESLLILPWCTN